jgi:ribosomal protein L37AE/L43A
MKSNLIARRKKAKLLVSLDTLRQAVQEAYKLEPILQSTNDARLEQLHAATAWLSDILALGTDAERSLDDAASPRYAQTAKKYVNWIGQLAGQFRTTVKQTEMPPKAPQAVAASSGSDPWVTDRDKEDKAKAPEKAEVPRLATKKTAQPAAPGAAPAATPPPPPPVPAAGPDGSVDVHQMSSDALSKVVKALADVELNDKAALALVEQAAKELKGRPVEAAPEPAPKKTASDIPGDPLGQGEFPFVEVLVSMGWSDEGDPGVFMKDDSRVEIRVDHYGYQVEVDGQVTEAGSDPEELHRIVEDFDELGGADALANRGKIGSIKDFGGLNMAPAEKEAAGKVAVAPPGAEHAVKEMKKDPDIDNPFALAWYMKNKGDKFKGSSFKEAQAAMRKELADQYLKLATGQGGSWFVHNQDTLKVTEDGGRTPEIAEAHGLEDEGPAKLDRPATELPSKFAADTMYCTKCHKDAHTRTSGGLTRCTDCGSVLFTSPEAQGGNISATGKNVVAADEVSASKALKQVEKLADRLKEMYLDAKEITEANDSRPVREAVEAIYRAYDLLGQAAKVLGKQQMQEQAEEDAVKQKEKGKKKGSLLDSLVLAGIEGGPDAPSAPGRL